MDTVLTWVSVLVAAAAGLVASAAVLSTACDTNLYNMCTYRTPDGSAEPVVELNLRASPTRLMEQKDPIQQKKPIQLGWYYGTACILVQLSRKFS